MSQESLIQGNKSLIDFEFLPDSAHIRVTTMMGLYGCSESTIWRSVRKGLIPRPKKLTSRTTVWNVGEVRKSLAKEDEEQS